VVPAAFLFGLGVLIGAIRRALRRPSRPEVKTTPQPWSRPPGYGRCFRSIAARAQHSCRFCRGPQRLIIRIAQVISTGHAWRRRAPGRNGTVCRDRLSRTKIVRASHLRP